MFPSKTGSSPNQLPVGLTYPEDKRAKTEERLISNLCNLTDTPAQGGEVPPSFTGVPPGAGTVESPGFGEINGLCIPALTLPVVRS